MCPFPRIGWLNWCGGYVRDETKKVKKRKKAAKATLSFAMDDDDEDHHSQGSEPSKPKHDEHDDDEPPVKRAKLKKNPNVDTSFLPDREREEAERKERERLRVEWLEKQDQLKNEDIEITYSYWDGSGHRKTVTVSFRIPFSTQCRSLVCLPV